MTVEHMPLSSEDLANLRKWAYVAVDGVWFLEWEKRHGFQEALEADIAVWQRLGALLINRIKKALGITTVGPKELEAILLSLWAVEDSDGHLAESSDSCWVFRITRCAWYENLVRAGRHKMVPCDLVDERFFPAWAEAIAPGMAICLTKAIPRGDPYCEWTVERK